jgi:eukaryotic-like serine/threonine-protein kinase
MEAARWRRVETLFAAAQSLDAEAAERYLREQCAGDESLEEEVASLLRHHRSDLSDLQPEAAPWRRLLGEPGGADPILLETRPRSDEKVGDDVGPYRLLRLLGRGGMGSVWYAERRDRLISRGVALKLPLGFGAQLAARFAREREIVARLAHPNIARLYDAGVSDSGQAYFALEYIEGKSLCEYCDEHQLDLRARLNLFRQVLDAVQYAHSRLVVHRDLKPTNILVSIDRQVHLLDFGVAKILGASEFDAELTRDCGAAMTVAYASPEQIAGRAVSTATDIYSLGVILFELIVGSRPYRVRHEGRGALESAILQADISLPSTSGMTDEVASTRSSTVHELRRALRGDLDAVILKALRNVPDQRYATVAAFGEDLDRYLDGHPVLAHRPSKWYRWRKFAARNRLAVTGAIAASAALLGLTSIAWWQERLAAGQETRAATVRDFMIDLIYDAEPDESRPNAQVTGKQLLDGAVLRAHRTFKDQPALRGELLGGLGLMYARLGDTDSAKALFAESVGLLERYAPGTDASLNKTRAQWARLLLDENEIDQAHVLAERAWRSCSRDTMDCSKARAYASNVLGRIALTKGDTELALVEMRKAVLETARGFGAKDQESALALLNLALIARRAGHIREAAPAMSQALQISQDQTLRATDRTQLLRSAAVIDLDMGRYESARERLAQLLSTTTDRVEHAVQMRLMANVLLALGNPAAALDSATSAIQLAANRTGEELLFSQQVHAQSLALLGKSKESVAEIEIVIQGLHDLGRSETSPEVLRAHRIRGEVLLRGARAEDAYKELHALATKLTMMPGGRPLELGQTLDLLGCALRELGRAGEAVAAHEDARAQLESQLPNGHPFLVRNALYRAVATHDLELFRQQAAQMESAVGADSIWHSLMDAQLDPAVCATSELPTCVFVL